MSMLAGIGSIIGGLGSLFGRKQKNPTPAQNIMSQAQGARQAAEAYGFNPLTMLQYGNPAGTGLANGGTPPLASIDMLIGGLRDVSDVTSGDAARRRQADELNLDMAKLKLDQARSGVLSVPIGAVNTVAKGPSPLGQRPVQVQQSNGTHWSKLGIDRDKDDRVSVMVGGKEIKPHKGMSNADRFEQRYGDLGSAFYGLGVLGSDVLNSFGPTAPAEIGPAEDDAPRIEKERKDKQQRDALSKQYYTHPQTGFTAPRVRFGM